MSHIGIEKLTAEQEQLITKYRRKWQEIVFSTKQIDKAAAAAAVKAAYTILGYEEPEIMFCDSPYAAFATILAQGICQPECEPAYCLSSQLWNQMKSQLSTQVTRSIAQQNEELKRLVSQQKNQLSVEIRRELSTLLNHRQRNLLIRSSLNIQPEKWSIYGSQSEFCISVLNCVYAPKKWEVFQSLIHNCGWILSYERVVGMSNSPIKFKKTAIICNRPIKLSLDSEYCLHADGEPAVQFADGYKLYSCRGVTSTKK